jgi:hypothetical protein
MELFLLGGLVLLAAALLWPESLPRVGARLGREYAALRHATQEFQQALDDSVPAPMNFPAEEFPASESGSRVSPPANGQEGNVPTYRELLSGAEQRLQSVTPRSEGEPILDSRAAEQSEIREAETPAQ